MNILILFLIIFSYNARSASVEVKCLQSETCDEIQAKLKSSFENLDSIKDEIRFIKSLSLNSSILRYSFKGRRPENGKRHYIISLSIRPRIGLIEIDAQDGINIEDILNIVNINEEDSLYIDEIQKALLRIQKYFEERGYTSVKASYKLLGKKNNPNLKIIIRYKDIIKIEKVQIKGDRNQIPQEVLLKMLGYKDSNLNEVELKIAIDQIKQELLGSGFYNSKVDFRVIRNLNSNKCKIIFSFSLGTKTNIYLLEMKHLSRERILKDFRHAIQNDGLEANRETLNKIITMAYKEKGIYESEISIDRRQGHAKNGTEFINFYIRASKGHKIKLAGLEFRGNVNIKVEKLRDLFYKKATTLSKRNYLDEKYLYSFVKILERYYLERGYILSKIESPKIVLAKDKGSTKVIYYIKENQQCLLGERELNNIPKELKELILGKWNNSIGLPLNIVELEKDIIKSLNEIRSRGYYFGDITNILNDNIVTYQNNYTRAKIKLDFNLGAKAVFNSLIVDGNKKTKSEVIERENPFKRGDIITPQDIKKFEERLKALGIFSRVQIFPHIINQFSASREQKINLLVHVKEEKFGQGEIAPGFRTNLGAKLSFNVAYRNLWKKKIIQYH